MIEVISIDTAALGDRSYGDRRACRAGSGPAAGYRPGAGGSRRAGAQVTHVFETRIHNDYVPGGLALARVTGAAYHVNAADEVAFDRIGVTDDDAIEVADSMRVRVRVRVVATPGHTFTHLSYALEDTATGRVTAVFTGGSLLHGSTGRPDLLGPAHKATLAAAQHASAKRLASAFPDETPVCPTHGFGSFCTAAQSGIDHLAGAATGSPQDWAGEQPLASFPLASFADLAAVRHHRPVTVLDVRRALEWAGGRLDGALHIPLQDLRARIGEVPGGEIWVHCRSGYRAVIAASLLQAAGHAVVAIDDEYARAADAGLCLVTGAAAGRAA